LDESAKEEFFDQSGFDEKPNEAKRQTEKQLVGGKMSVPEGNAAAAEKILESKKNAANYKHDWQMTASERMPALALNSEIAKPTTETESKDREWNRDENDKLLCERDKEPGPRGIDPRGRKMLINPLRTADQINRQDNNVSDQDD
jgi:hypothetical protein